MSLSLLIRLDPALLPRAWLRASGCHVAIAGIREGEPVRKYGQTIGFASKAITPGDWVHEQNVGLRDFARDYKFAEGAKNDEILSPDQRATFEGYLRPNGKTGTRNY